MNIFLDEESLIPLDGMYCTRHVYQVKPRDYVKVCRHDMPHTRYCLSPMLQCHRQND